MMAIQSNLTIVVLNGIETALATFNQNVFNSSMFDEDIPVNSRGDSNDDMSCYRRVKTVAQYVVPIIFIFGIVGNSVCVAVFGRKLIVSCRQRHGLKDNVEMSAASGFFLLALSDLLLNVTGLPDSFISKATYANAADTIDVTRLQLRVIQPALLNMWIFTSTWITCILSIERYFVISYPLRAKRTCSPSITVGSGLVILVASLALNFPSFFQYSVKCDWKSDAMGECYLVPAKFLMKRESRLTYHLAWSFVGCIIPFCILCFCNFRLLVALHRNLSSFSAEGTQSRRHSKALEKNSGRRARQVTLILALVVTMYLLLVTPASCLELVRPFLPMSAGGANNSYRAAIVIMNMTQAANFSFGFVLYACLSSRFRRDVTRLACMQNRPMAESSVAVSSYESSSKMLNYTIRLVRQQVNWRADWNPG